MSIGNIVGFIAVAALLAASIVIALLDRKEKARGNTVGNFMSRLALGLFLAAFIGGVVVTLVAGVTPRQEERGMESMGGGMPPMVGGMGSIGTIDQQELQQLEAKIAKDPQDVASRERLGHLYLQMQDFQRVFEMAHEALRVDPKSVESRVHMGMVLYAMQQMDQAMQQFDQALAIDPKHLEGLLFKGIVQFQGTGDMKGAKTTWEKYLKLAPPNDPGRPRVTAFLQMLEGQEKR